jgi:hypothetical protein
MNAPTQNSQHQDSRYRLECKVTPTADGYSIEGNFHAFVSTNAPDTELDQIETGVDCYGQQVKRDVCQKTLEAADERCAEVVKTIQPDWHVLCWYHLRTRIYQGLGALGLAKEQRKLLEREILGHLWRGKTAEAVWILWGLRSSARVPKRIDDLMGYLLRKRHMIVDYEDRKQRGLWLSSTRVEKWNDSVADRCKHRGMAWTSSGVLAVVLYAAEQKRKAKKRPARTPKRNKKMHTTI